MIIEQDAVDAPVWSGEEATVALRASALFGEATDAELARVASSCRIETVAAGTVVVREGDAADDAYLLLGGELLAYSHDDLGRSLALERISQVNRLVGEQAVLSRHGVRRTASVRAITDCRLLRVPGGGFRELVERDHVLAERLRKLGARQIREKVSQQMALLRRLATARSVRPVCTKRLSRTAHSSAGRASSAATSTSSCPAACGCSAARPTAASCRSRGCKPGNPSASSA